jgi:IS5 family transposase
MTLGVAARQGDLFDDLTVFCEQKVSERSIYGLLRRERDRLFPDEAFADLFTEVGRRSVPPSVVATVMVLQRLEGLSDREAVERFCFDSRWRYAAGVGGYGTAGWTSFAHTVLVDMRARLAASVEPDRIFAAVLDMAAQAGLVGRKRAIDSTPLYDAVATMDTVTLIRSAIRGLLRVAGPDLSVELSAALSGCDDYASAAKPVIDWDDRAAREELIDSRAKDAHACLRMLSGRQLDQTVEQAARLVATVVGQDLEEGEDRVFRIARRVAPDRVISTVDPQARHGHKTAARSFDGYKGHAAVDPDSEIITATAVTPGNAGDASVAEDLIADLLGDNPPASGPGAGEPSSTDFTDAPAESAAEAGRVDQDRPVRADADPASIYGDNAYGTGAFQQRLDDAGVDSKCKTQQPRAAGGVFAKDRFEVDLDADTVTCPAGQVVPIRRGRGGDGMACFGQACASCPLREQCTRSGKGRTIRVGIHESALARARARQSDPEWQADYRATRPKVERKLAHLMRRRHGGRRARVRGEAKVDADFRLLAAAANLARLATLGVRATSAGWATATA